MAMFWNIEESTCPPLKMSVLLLEGACMDMVLGTKIHVEALSGYWYEFVHIHKIQM